MKRVHWLALLTCVPGILSPDTYAQADERDAWIFPGEFESHEALWMLWPTFEYKAGFPATEPMGEMIRALHGHTHVSLAVQSTEEEADARAHLLARRIPLEHVHFQTLPHGDIWARDMGPQFTRSRAGELRINDWNFNMWGHEEPTSEASSQEEAFDRAAATAMGFPTLDARRGEVSGVRMIHEGGGVTHNGEGTMIAVESVVMQRNLGPNRFCGGEAPVTDYAQPNTYRPHTGWPLCKDRVEAEYRRMLGATHVIWIPTGVIEDNGTFRGPLAQHIHVPHFAGIDIPHAGVYSVFTTNGHADEFVRFVAPDTVLLAQATRSRRPGRSAVERLTQWIEEQNHARLERVHDILASAETQAGTRLRVLRIPTPVPTLDVFAVGDGTYDYFQSYQSWEDGSTVAEVMLGVWAASYVNYLVSNDLVLVPKYWQPGGSLEVWLRDQAARHAIERAFPGRTVRQIDTGNVNRGGGGLNCITQQQPASRSFSQRCGWSKVRVGRRGATVYLDAHGQAALRTVERLSRAGAEIYLQRLGSSGTRAYVRVVADSQQASALGWMEESEIEAATERCPDLYRTSQHRAGRPGTSTLR